MPIFIKNNKKLLFIGFLLFFLFYNKAEATILYSQDKIDSFHEYISPDEYPLKEANAFQYTAGSTTIASIAVYADFSTAVNADYCHAIDIYDETSAAHNYFYDSGKNICNATTTAQLYIFDENFDLYEFQDGHWYSIIFPPYSSTDNTGTRVYGTKQSFTTWSCAKSDGLDCFYLSGGLNDFAFWISDNPNELIRPVVPQSVVEFCDNYDFGGLGIGNAFCNVLKYLFVPTQNTIQNFANLKDNFLNKPPLGYYLEVKRLIGQLNATNTPAFILSGVDSLGDIVDPFRVGIAWILWFMFAFWVIKRIGSFNF